MGRSHHPTEDPGEDLDKLGRIYLKAVAMHDVWEHDSGFIRLTTNLGAILACLGWHPDCASASPLPGSEAAS